MGRRLHFTLSEYLMMPFRVFTDFCNEELEMLQRERTKSKT